MLPHPDFVKARFSDSAYTKVNPYYNNTFDSKLVRIAETKIALPATVSVIRQNEGYKSTITMTFDLVVVVVLDCLDISR